MSEKAIREDAASQRDRVVREPLCRRRLVFLRDDPRTRFIASRAGGQPRLQQCGQELKQKHTQPYLADARPKFKWRCSCSVLRRGAGQPGVSAHMYGCVCARVRAGTRRLLPECKDSRWYVWPCLCVSETPPFSSHTLSRLLRSAALRHSHTLQRASLCHPHCPSSCSLPSSFRSPAFLFCVCVCVSVRAP